MLSNFENSAHVCGGALVSGYLGVALVCARGVTCLRLCSVRVVAGCGAVVPRARRARGAGSVWCGGGGEVREVFEGVSGCP